MGGEDRPDEEPDRVHVGRLHRTSFGVAVDPRRAAVREQEGRREREGNPDRNLLP